PALDQQVGELGDRGRLARAVHPDDQDDRRTARRAGERALAALQAREQLLAQQLGDLGRLGDLALPPGLLQLLDHARAGDAEVGAVQHLFQLVEEALVELAAQGEQAGEAGSELVARLLQPAQQAAEDHQEPCSSGRRAGAPSTPFSMWIRARWRMPLMDEPEFAVESRLPSSIASLIVTLGGMSGQYISS